jgi:O-acetyl-ADP-ribose deacetylase (regulator of RNase III)
MGVGLSKADLPVPRGGLITEDEPVGLFTEQFEAAEVRRVVRVTEARNGLALVPPVGEVDYGGEVVKRGLVPEFVELGGGGGPPLPPGANPVDDLVEEFGFAAPDYVREIVQALGVDAARDDLRAEAARRAEPPPLPVPHGCPPRPGIRVADDIVHGEVAPVVVGLGGGGSPPPPPPVANPVDGLVAEFGFAEPNNVREIVQAQGVEAARDVLSAEAARMAEPPPPPPVTISVDDLVEAFGFAEPDYVWQSVQALGYEVARDALQEAAARRVEPPPLPAPHGRPLRPGIREGTRPTLVPALHAQDAVPVLQRGFSGDSTSSISDSAQLRYCFPEDRAGGQPALRLRLVRTDITRWIGDAVVSAANPRLTDAGGIDSAIRHAAGDALVHSCRALPLLDGGVKCRVGCAVLTRGPFRGANLGATHVIHVVGPRADGKQQIWIDAFCSALEVAAGADVVTLALPIVSTGKLVNARMPCARGRGAAAAAAAAAAVPPITYLSPHDCAGLRGADKDEAARALLSAIMTFWATRSIGRLARVDICAPDTDSVFRLACAAADLRLRSGEEGDGAAATALSCVCVLLCRVRAIANEAEAAELVTRGGLVVEVLAGLQRTGAAAFVSRLDFAQDPVVRSSSSSIQH